MRARNANIEHARLVAGARELIDALQQAGHPVGLLTNGPSVMQRRKLAVTGLDRVLDAIAISEEIAASKPDERAYLRAAELLGSRFDYLFVSPAELEDLVESTGWSMERTIPATDGRLHRRA